MSRDPVAPSLPTYLENWPPGLAALAIPHADVPLVADEARLLGQHALGRDVYRPQVVFQALSGLAERVDAAIKPHPAGAFVRLGSRSGKDSRGAAVRGLRVRDGWGALAVLAEGSRRVGLDLDWAVRNAYEAHVFVRPWVEIPRWAELRCFMRQRRLIGISQYHARANERFPELAARATAIQAAVGTFFDQFRAACHLDNVVFDVFLRPGGPSGDGFQVLLLDLNPFSTLSDPILFDWENPDAFDGSFRFLQSPR